MVDTPVISFDTETRSIYSQEDVKEAKLLLKNEHEIPYEYKKITNIVSRASGLSYPGIVDVTHFIFGFSKDSSSIFITRNIREELLIWNWLARFRGKVLIHNSLFDLKLMYQRIGKLPLVYEDTQLLAKSLINNAENWKAKVGLKQIMAEYYDPRWALVDDYNIKNLKDEAFLDYCACDGAATFYLWEILQEYMQERLEKV